MKRLVITAVAVYVTGFLISFLVHGVLLAEDYKSISHLLRPEHEMKMGVMSLGYVFWAFGVAWLFSKGVESKPWLGQGLRFGLALACVWIVPTYLGTYATQPFPASLTLKGLAGDTINALVCGVVAAAVYRGAGTGKTQPVGY